MKLHILRHVPLPARIAVVLAAIALGATACMSGSSGNGSAGSSNPPPSGGAVTLQTRTGPPGTYVTDSTGRSLYLFASDSATKSTCSGACATAWPPLTTNGKVSAGSGVTASDISMIKRSDGTQQVVYHGHPLYYFAGDGGAGQTNGQGSTAFGARWWLVQPSGQSLTSSGGSSGSSSGPGGY